MLRVLKKLGWLMLALLVSVIVFYFWASGTTWPEQNYAQIIDYKLPANRSGDSTLRVITYNIGYLSGMTNNEAMERPIEMLKAHQDQVEKAFADLSPHIIGLQEVDYEADRSFGVNQMEAVAIATGLSYGAQAVNWDKRYVPFPYFPPSMHFGKIVSGQALLSCYPMEEHERIALKRPEGNTFYYDAFYIDRLLQIVRLSIENRTVTVMNVHLEAYDKQTRAVQGEYVLHRYREYLKQGPVILLGDFNSRPASNQEEQPTIQLFLEEASLASAVPLEVFQQASTFTYPADEPKEQIDYIFYSKDHFESLSWKVVQSTGTASDHLAVFWEGKFKD